MTTKFEIKELEKIVEPEDLVDCLDSLLDNDKISSYYYDFENGTVTLEIPNNVVIEELFNNDTKRNIQ